VSREEKRPAPSGNSERANNEAAPGESITDSVPPGFDYGDDTPSPSTSEEREWRARLARRRKREADKRRSASEVLTPLAAEISQREAMVWFAPSEGWLRNLANDLAAAWGFDPEFIERKYKITRRSGVSA